MRTWAGELRRAARSLLKRPGVTVVAVLSLALGVGVTTTAFSLLNALSLRDYPGVVEQSRLVTLALGVESPEGREPSSVELAWPDVERIGEWNELFSGVAAAGGLNVALGTGAEPVSEEAELVSAEYFAVLGTRPWRGRLLGPGDAEAGTGSMVLAHRVYQALGEPEDVLGRRLEVNGLAFTVVGVAPPRFTGMLPGDVVTEARAGPGLWLSLAEAGRLRPEWREGDPLGVEHRWVRAVARLRNGVSPERLTAALPAVAGSLERAEPELRRGARLDSGDLWFGPGVSARRATLTLAAFMVVPLLVLLIACANATNLLLARTTERSRELAVRSALGATRGALIRGVLAESVLLALAAGVLGLGVAFWSRELASLYAIRLSMDAPLDPRVFAFTLAVAIGAGVLLGLVPALRASRPDVAGTLASAERTTGTRGAARLRRGLVVAQVSLSVVLLVVAGLFVRSAGRGMAVPTGLDEARLGILTLDLDVLRYDEPAGRAFQERLVEEARRLPDVEAAALADSPPLAGRPVTRVAHPEERIEFGRGARLARVGEQYFRTAGVTLLAGRAPESGRKEAVVSRALADALWPEGGALGRPLRVGRSGESRVVEVVGVAADAREELHRPPEPVVYRPAGSGYSASTTLYVRSASPDAALRAVRGLVARLDPRLPIASLETAGELRERELVHWRLLARGLGTMGLLALLLAVFGLYGVMAFSVARRQREIGVRMALGASRSGVLGMVVRESLSLVAIGLLLGGAAAAGLALLLQSLLFGVSPVDPVTYGGLALLLLGVGAVAAVVPARRAARVEPVRALSS